MLMSLKDPFVFAAKISHMRVIKSADISLYTDASTSVGGARGYLPLMTKFFKKDFLDGVLKRSRR